MPSEPVIYKAIRLAAPKDDEPGSKEFYELIREAKRQAREGEFSGRSSSV